MGNQNSKGHAIAAKANHDLLMKIILNRWYKKIGDQND